MNTDLFSAMELAASLKTVDANSALQVIVFPPAILIHPVLQLLNDSAVQIGAQNCYHERSGAFTGENSAKMISSVGATHVLVGHSERRSLFGESHSMLLKKVNLALEEGLQIVFCIGETLSEKESGLEKQVVKEQLNESLFHLTESQIKNVIIAYEPVWAIGTGKTSSPDQAQLMHEFIRSLVNDKYSAAAAESISILYGGSCNASNASELFAQPDIDGGLIGGASLKADEFKQIIAIMSSQHAKVH